MAMSGKTWGLIAFVVVLIIVASVLGIGCTTSSGDKSGSGSLVGQSGSGGSGGEDDG